MLDYSETSENVYLTFNQHIELKNKKCEILVHLTFLKAEDLAEDVKTSSARYRKWLLFVALFLRICVLAASRATTELSTC